MKELIKGHSPESTTMKKMKTTNSIIEDLANKIIEHHEVSPQDLMHDAEAGAYPQDVTTYTKGKRYAENGCYLISGYDAQALLMELYSQTEEEGRKYSIQASWEQYCHLVGRAFEVIERKAAEA